MDRFSTWIDGQIADHMPERSDNKQSVVVLADACAALSGKGSLAFGMTMPPDLQNVDELYARACAALAAWFPKLETEEAELLATRVRQQGLDVPIPESAGGNESGESIEARCARLGAAREQSLRRLGVLNDGVLARSRPIQFGDEMYPRRCPRMFA